METVRGSGSISDMLSFSIIVSAAAAFLFQAPFDPASGSTRYAASYSQSLLLSLKNITAGQLGGFRYNLGVLGLDLPSSLSSAVKNLRYKTVTDLLVEDALLNMKAEFSGENITILNLSADMDEKLRLFLKSALDEIICGRFGYRLSARTAPIDLGVARLSFETTVENLDGWGRQFWLETTNIPLPASSERLVSLAENALGLDLPGLEADPFIKLTLELWSR
ncbi:MAG: hypothetical protein AB1305_06045 [Candidatus Hadarchaeota archaeon]